jgi:hypothetical protein
MPAELVWDKTKYCGGEQIKCDETGGEDKGMRGHLEDTHADRWLDSIKTDCKEMGWKFVG